MPAKQKKGGVLYPISKIKVGDSKEGPGKPCQVFMDSGAASSLILESTAKKLKLEKIKTETIKISTINQGKPKETNLYRFYLFTPEGAPREVKAYGVEYISEKISLLDMRQMHNWFAGKDISGIQ